MNDSGLTPVEYKVLVRLDGVPPISKGGIIIPDDIRERKAMSEVRGTLVAAGGNAFEDWKGDKPAVGQRVYVAKYAGLVVETDEGKTYRLMNDKDIAAVLT